MRSVVITVAGMSSRFNADLDKKTLKCIYYETSPADSLLMRQMEAIAPLVDEIVIVGGYMYDDLCRFVGEHAGRYADKVKLVENNHYHDYGSCYSLLKGIEAASKDATELIFVEGDLFFHPDSVSEVILSPVDVVTVNADPITSDKAVAFYIDAGNHPHYIYDTHHSCLEINEPFLAIYNSAQMWKFRDMATLRRLCCNLTPARMQGTNLEVVQGYFGNKQLTEMTVVKVMDWVNCNTVADYRRAINIM